jgi:hypothetical protein
MKDSHGEEITYGINWSRELELVSKRYNEANFNAILGSILLPPELSRDGNSCCR